ncbi:MAG: hypothetical protein LBD77_08585, partial [Bifidobacteriaceae bacterium]|nr:hypothetical protein [Bifidobacteriaceae bacterium]
MGVYSARRQVELLELEPVDYLWAGLPNPGHLPGRVDSHGTLVRAGEIPDLSGYPADAEDLPWAYTAVDEDDRPLEVAVARNRRYLFKPAYWNPNREADVVSVARDDAMGLLDVTLGEPGPLRGNDLRARRPDPATDRLATADLSVFLAGLRPTKFRADDAIFVSIAVIAELMLMFEHHADGTRRRGMASSWRLSTPVPLDQEILGRYMEIAFNLPSGNPHGLRRTDLMCAATASVYGAVMYTTKPEAYIGAGYGLKTLKYGKTRNPAAVDHKTLPPPTQLT